MIFILLLVFFFICRDSSSSGWVVVQHIPNKITPKSIIHGDWPLIRHNGKWYHRDRPTEELVTVSFEEFLENNNAQR